MSALQLQLYRINRTVMLSNMWWCKLLLATWLFCSVLPPPSTMCVAAQPLRKAFNNDTATTMARGSNWLVNAPRISQTGELVHTSHLQGFKDLQPVRPGDDPPFRGWDNEAYDALHRFFWGMEKGIVLEMGALDGKHFSVSRDFLPFKWHRILIDATPKWRHAAKEVSSDATFISAAICSSNSIVHYLSRPQTDNAINGIAEFMTENFLRDMHPNVYKEARKSGHFALDQVDWTKFTSRSNHVFTDSISHPMECLRMDSLLESIQVTKINFFVLDVEGGELEVLKSIDFSKVSFDVLCIEVEKARRPPNFKQDVQRLLEQHNYQLVFEQGRNAWFQAATFKPSSAR